MPELAVTLLAFAGAYLALALLALGQAQQHRRVAPLASDGRPCTKRRAPAALLLAVSLALALATQGAGFGVLLWFLLLGLAGIAVAQTLAWKPHWLRPLLRAASLKGRDAAE